MQPGHCLLLKAVVGDADDSTLLAGVTELRRILAVPFAEFAVYRGLRTPDLYAYGVLEGAAHPTDGDLHRFAAMARQLPAFAASAPARTPPARIEQLNAAVRRVLTSESYRKRLLESGAEPVPSSPGELAALVKTDTAKWGRIIRDKKIKGE